MGFCGLMGDAGETRGQESAPTADSVPGFSMSAAGDDDGTWEPVSGIEPLTCRLQDGCSAN
jgi:hypothetical protein